MYKDKRCDSFKLCGTARYLLIKDKSVHSNYMYIMTIMSRGYITFTHVLLIDFMLQGRINKLLLYQRFILRFSIYLSHVFCKMFYFEL